MNFYNTLFDSGASESFMLEKYAKKLAHLEMLPEPIELATASEGTFMKATHRIVVDFYINDIRLSDEFLVLPNLTEDVVIGATTLQKWRIKLNFDIDDVEIPEALKGIKKVVQLKAIRGK